MNRRCWLHRLRPKFSFSIFLGASLSLGCGRDEQHATNVQRDMKEMISTQLQAWLNASVELRDAAPPPQADGWNVQRDAEALAATRRAWGASRQAYERIEGAVAKIFPESDTATDARYEDYLAVLGGPGDPHPFDDEGVIGMHGIERVLWADSMTPQVTHFERGLPGYREPRMPQTEQEAAAFKTKLAARLVSDIERLQQQFEPLSLDIAFAFRGLIDLAAEQVEKVDRASSGQEESRYAQTTMSDLRANSQGCKDAYEIFKPWLIERGGADIDARITEAFARLDEAYAEVPGDAIPVPPKSWTSLKPNADQLASPFGKLFSAVRREADPSVSGSLHASLVEVAEKLELPSLVTR